MHGTVPLHLLKLNSVTDLRVHSLVAGLGLAPEPPVRQDPPELHVENDGVSPEESQLLLQHGSLLGPGGLVTLETLQLQTRTLGLQTQTILFLM